MRKNKFYAQCRPSSDPFPATWPNAEVVTAGVLPCTSRQRHWTPLHLECANFCSANSPKTVDYIPAIYALAMPVPMKRRQGPCIIAGISDETQAGQALAPAPRSNLTTATAAQPGVYVSSETCGSTYVQTAQENCGPDCLLPDHKLR